MSGKVLPFASQRQPFTFLPFVVVVVVVLFLFFSAEGHWLLFFCLVFFCVSSSASLPFCDRTPTEKDFELIKTRRRSCDGFQQNFGESLFYFILF